MKMPTEAAVLPTQPEKPHHYTYLKEFRTQQCPLFLQHKCAQHRPFTCFHWHFANQRRRRPVRKRDGTFNYSSDIYCTKYDENSGMCSDGDECPLLHRTAGDTERRYHLRYYKTGTCVHDTDSKGHCEKNGAHCAFAHGHGDLRTPVYDVRELQAMELGGTGDLLQTVVDTAAATPKAIVGSLEKEKSAGDDPCWNDTSFVLANYKTEPCKRPPRLCRQGYACPQFHNNRDRRRSPHKSRYRSTPCPNVKHGDEWGDPLSCDSGDACSYCHTRTEQQFHPEIYKSTKCNDMVQTGYCPRGPFCAFAHVEQEMVLMRDCSSASTSGTSILAEYMHSGRDEDGEGLLDNEEYLMDQDKMAGTEVLSQVNGKVGSPGLLPLREQNNSNNNSTKLPIGGTGHINVFSHLDSGGPLYFLPDPIGKGRTNSLSSSDGRLTGGSDRVDDSQAKMRQLRLQIDTGGGYAGSDIALGCHVAGNSSAPDCLTPHRKQSLLHSFGSYQSHSFGSNTSTPSPTMSASMSPFAMPFFPPAGDMVESFLSHTLDDLNTDDFDLTSIDKELEREEFNDNGSGTGASSAGASLSGHQFSAAVSMPVSIPSAMPGGGGGQQRCGDGSVASLPYSPPSTTVAASSAVSLPMHFQPSAPRQRQDSVEQMNLHFVNQLPGCGGMFAMQPTGSDNGVFSPRSLPSFNGSFSNGIIVPVSTVQQVLSSNGACPASSAVGQCHCSSNAEIALLHEELARYRARLLVWEEGHAQARTACDAWKKEVDESCRKAKDSEEQKQIALRQRDEAVSQLAKVKQELESKVGNQYLKTLYRYNELESLSVNQLKGLQQQLRRDLEKIDQIVHKNAHGSSR